MRFVLCSCVPETAMKKKSNLKTRNVEQCSLHGKYLSGKPSGMRICQVAKMCSEDEKKGMECALSKPDEIN